MEIRYRKPKQKRSGQGRVRKVSQPGVIMRTRSKMVSSMESCTTGMQSRILGDWRLGGGMCPRMQSGDRSRFSLAVKMRQARKLKAHPDGPPMAKELMKAEF